MTEIEYEAVIVSFKGKDFKYESFTLGEDLPEGVGWAHVIQNRIYCFVDDRTMEKWLKETVPPMGDYEKGDMWKYYQRGQKLWQYYSELTDKEDPKKWIDELQNWLISCKSRRWTDFFEKYKDEHPDWDTIEKELKKEGLLNSVVIFSNQCCIVRVPIDNKTIGDLQIINNLSNLLPTAPPTSRPGWKEKIKSLNILNEGCVRLNIHSCLAPPPDWYFWGPWRFDTLPAPIDGLSNSLQTLQQE